MMKPWRVNLSEYTIKKNPTFCLLYKNSELFQLLASFSYLSPVVCYFCQVSWAMVISEGPSVLLGWVDAVHMVGAAASGSLLAGKQGALPPSLCRVLCHSPASRACEGSALREGLLQNYYFRGFADLGSHPCSNNTLAGSSPAYGSWHTYSLFLDRSWKFGLQPAPHLLGEPGVWGTPSSCRMSGEKQHSPA